MTSLRAVAVSYLLVLFSLSTYSFAQPLATDTTLVPILGTIYEVDQTTPIPYVTVQEVGSGRATMSNADGEYRLLVSPASTHLKFSHVAYKGQLVSIDRPTETASTDVDAYLTPSDIQLEGMVVTAQGLTAGMRIIAEAIKRKKDVLDLLHDYRFDAYTKTVIRDATKPDSMPIWLITEVQSTSYWEQPGKYREVITARKQTANMSPEDNLISVGDVLNFSSDRIDLGRYSIPSPTATDAMDHYKYYLVDTVQVNDRDAFRLEMRPANPDLPRFVGHILIVDSTYDLVDVDLGFSRGVEMSMIHGAKFGQRFALFDELWMPVEMRFEGMVHIKVPQPFIPSKLDFSYIATITDYDLDEGHEKDTFGDAMYEVAEGADDVDSVAWFARQAVVPTAEELGAYVRIDSLENLPPTPGKLAATAVGGATALALGAAPDLFRFNRVEGVYLGLSNSFTLGKKLSSNVKLGYSWGTKRVQHEISSRYRLSKKRQWDVGASYQLATPSRPSITTSPRYNPAGSALLTGMDPFNYYSRQGLSLWTRVKVAKPAYLSLSYNDADHRSVGVNDPYMMWHRDMPLRDNPAIADGILRSVAAQLRFDTRPVLMNKGYESYYDAVNYTRLWLGVEHASPDLISNDFDFTLFYVRLYHRMKTLGLGITSIYANAAASSGELPPQRFFSTDFGPGYLYRPGVYQNFGEQTFGGRRGASLRFHHNFQRLLFTKSGIPLIKDIPFWLTIHGNFLWADMVNLAPRPGDVINLYADNAYSEIGFGLENLTPFLSPLNLAVHFTWQASEYGTKDFSWRIGFNLR